MNRITKILLASTALVALTIGGVARADDPHSGNRNEQDHEHEHEGPAYRHVLLISVDGLHAFDLTNYVAAHPTSAMAKLTSHGIVYPNALTTAPSDSFPGLLAPVTGGTSKSSGVFYDVSYDRSLFGPGTNCVGSPGWAAAFDEFIDVDRFATNGGGTLGRPLTQIDASKLPLALKGGKCVPVYPHEFIETNTIFEVIKDEKGWRTAWADKHPAYDIVNGQSGKGVDDLFTPEVDSNDALTGQDTTLGFHSVQRNDALKVQAVLNEIDGYASTDDAHAKQIGMPAILGMNFQSVSVGQKLPAGNTADPQDAGLKGGYLDAVGAQPNSGLQSGLDFVDASLGQFVTALQQAGHADDTLVIVEAKHGQSPVNVKDEKPFDDGPYANTPGIGTVGNQGSGSYTTDDLSLVWLQPSAQKSQYDAAKTYLQQQSATLGITTLLDKNALAPLYGSPFDNNRTPDFIGITEHGLIYTGNPPKKLAEHGGFDPQDRNVALLVSNPHIDPQVNTAKVETRQIAPTILSVLGIDPKELKAVRNEDTKTLPGQYLSGSTFHAAE